MINRLKTALANAALCIFTASAAIAVGSYLPAMLDQLRGHVKKGDYAGHVADLPQRLTLYGTTTCPHCIRARQFLKLSGIPFNDLILDASPQRQSMFAKLNEDGVPVLVSRTGLVSGFNADAYAALAKDSSLE